jgi:hypothetical protein
LTATGEFLIQAGVADASLGARFPIARAMWLGRGRRDLGINGRRSEMVDGEGKCRNNAMLNAPLLIRASAPVNRRG